MAGWMCHIFPCAVQDPCKSTPGLLKISKAITGVSRATSPQQGRINAEVLVAVPASQPGSTAQHCSTVAAWKGWLGALQVPVDAWTAAARWCGGCTASAASG